MSGIVKIKGNRYGLSVNIAEDAPFEEVKAETAKSFKKASKMFGKDAIAIGFEGKILTDSEKEELTEVIKESCDLDIVCIMDLNSGTEEKFKRAVRTYEMPDYLSDILNKKNSVKEVKEEEPVVAETENIPDERTTETSGNDDPSMARFFKGNVRSGIIISEENSLVIIGDINPGGEVYSAGNIIVLGSLKGKAFAGINGNSNAFVFALNMDPIQIRIADTIGRASDSKQKKSSKTDEHEPKIALVKDNAIAIELVSRTVLNDIIL